MSLTTPCARCPTVNPVASRFCAGCGLPLGAAEADAGAWMDLLGPDDGPESANPEVARLVRDFVSRAGADVRSVGSNWRLDVLLPMGRKQAVFVGEAGIRTEGVSIVTLVSISGTANDRDPRLLLKWNARTVEAHFAIQVLRGEEYFVVICNQPADELAGLDARSLIFRIAETADNLEDRLTRGRDLF